MHHRKRIIGVGGLLLLATLFRVMLSPDSTREDTPGVASTGTAAGQAQPVSTTPDPAAMAKPQTHPSPTEGPTALPLSSSHETQARTGIDRLEALLKDGVQLASREEPGRRPTEQHRISLWKTAFKYPLIRVQETLIEGRVTQWTATVADHLMVRTREDLTPTDIAALAEEVGLSVRKIMYTPRTYLLAIPRVGLDSLPQTLARVARHPALAVAEADYIVYTMQTLPNDTSFGNLWGLNNTGQNGGTADIDIDAPEMWDLTTGNTNTIVGVIDTGIDYEHPDLTANIWINPGETASDGIDNDGNGLVDDIRGWDFANDDNDPMDGDGHGTHCSGTIGGVGNNGAGVAGVNWVVRLMALKFLSDDGFGSTSDATDAITYGTAMGVDLTSNSWGGGGYSDTLRLAIAEAYSNGIPFIAAAGNAASDNDQTENYPSNYEVENIVAVAAYDRNGNLASFSSYGATTVDVGAPGVDIYSSVAGGGYENYSGTSMATPHVAGLVAMMLGVNPGLTPEDVLSFLIATADPMPALDGKTVANGGINAYSAILAVSGPAIQLTETSVQDDGANSTQGNGDGVANPGETIGLWIAARNYGTESATGVQATLMSGDGSVTVSNAVIHLGTISNQASVAATNAFLLEIGSVSTPYPVELTCAFLDVSGNAWTSRFTLTLYTSTAVSGLVNSAEGPVPGALITYSGPMSGTTTSQPDGSYAITLTDGSYALQATKQGYIADGPYTINATGTATRQDFYLGKPEIEVAFNPVTLTLKQCETESIPIVITNAGDGMLRFECLGLPDEWQAETGTLWHVSQRRAYEGQESWYYGQEDIGTYDTGAANRGALISSPLLLPEDMDDFSFYSWRQTENSGLWDLSQFDVSTNRGLTWSTVFSASDTTQNWVQASVPLTQYAGQGVNFRFRFDTIDGIANDYEGWYVDRFRINQRQLGWVTFDTTAGNISSGGTETVYLQVNPSLLAPGTYTNPIALLSNDGDEGNLIVPLTLTVEASALYAVEDWSITGDDDNDGYPEPGETIELWVTLKNDGALNITNGLVLGLFPTDTNATVQISTSAAPVVVSGGSTTSTTPFRVAFPSSLPGDTNTPIELSLLIEDGSGCAVVRTLLLPVRDYATACGEVLDECTGLPLAGITVNATTGSGAEVPPELTDGAGQFCLHGIPSLDAVIQFSSADHAATSFPVVLSYASNVQVQIAMRNDLILTSPSEGYAVELPPESNAWHAVTLINSGACAVSYCVAGQDGQRDVTFHTGYRYRHSGFRNGPQYQWIDISATGTPLTMSDDDVKPVAIGFPFPFYGQAFTNLFLCSNGWLSFSEQGTDYFSYPLPNLAAAANMIAFFWTDLNPSGGGSVHYQTIDADTLVIQFTDVPYFFATENISIQVVLKATGEIFINTLDMDIPFDPVVTGIQNEDGTDGFTVFNPGNFPGAFTTILIDPGVRFATLPAALACGTIEANSSQSTPILFETSGLPGESYDATLYLDINDGSRTVAVPVSLAVTGRFAYLVVTEPEAGSLTCTDSPPSVCPSTTPRTWGLWAEVGTTEAVRPVLGNRFSLNFDNGWISPGKTVGFNLRNASGSELLTFYFVGGESTYSVLDARGKVSTGIPWTDQGFRIHIEVVETNYTLTAHRYENSQDYTVQGPLGFGGTASAIHDLRIFNYEAGPGSNYDVFVNQILVDGAMDNASQVSYTDGWQAGDGMEGGLLPWTRLTNGGSGGHFIGESRATGADSTACAAWGWATDGAPLAVTFSETNEGAGCGSLTRQWSVADGGPTLAVQRVYTVVDVTPPVITGCAPNITVSNLLLAPVNTNLIVATDECAVPEITHLGDTDNGGLGTEENPLVVYRRYAAIDPCGNTTVCTQRITVISIPSVVFEAGDLHMDAAGFTLEWSTDTQAWQYIDAMDHAPITSDFPWIAIHTVAPPSPAISTFTDTNGLPGRNYRVRVVIEE
ncbi:MAG: S8 family serine peptidase [Kiritimatiellae bacterium]|nr:S8 family serine peptidase [Kiritimatiellia bacterium]